MTEREALIEKLRVQGGFDPESARMLADSVLAGRIEVVTEVPERVVLRRVPGQPTRGRP